MAITDLTGTKWVLNNSLTAYAGGSYSFKNYDVNITLDEATEGINANPTATDSFVKIGIGYSSGIESNQVCFCTVSNDTYVWAIGNDTTTLPDTWNNVITIPFTITGGTDATNSALISWLESNATMKVDDVVVSYNGSTIATLNERGTAVLETDDTFLSDDITIAYNKPSDGGGKEFKQFIENYTTITKITNSATKIASYTFYSCICLNTVSFSACSRIEDYAFYSCPNLTTLNFPTCEYIGSYVFWSCYKLTTASFPACKTIGNYAFYSCRNLTALNFPVCMTIYGNAFTSCTNSNLTTANFPSCLAIGNYAFSSCYGLTTASFPICTNIGNYAFNSCSSLTTASFPSCKTIGSYAFQLCWNLTTLSLPSCTGIASGAFSKCFNLVSLYLTGSSVASLGNSNAFTSTPIAGYTASTGGVHGRIYVPSSLYISYINATNWTYFGTNFVSV